jgi:hypothetical protein
MRGRTSCTVRDGPEPLVRDVPEGDVLPAWAAEAHKKQAASVVFLDASGGRAVETLRLPAAYCVAYQEQFASGDAAGGAYQCFLTLSDPTGWTMAPGGPASAFVSPAAREHGVPGVAAAVVAPAAWRSMGIGGDMGTPASVSRKLVDPTDVPPHRPAPPPNPVYAQVHVSQAEWAAKIAGRWERNQESKNKKFTFLEQDRNTEFHVAGDPFTYRVGGDGKMEAVYDAQMNKSYNVTGTRKGFLRIPLTLKDGEPTYAGTEHMYPVTGNQRNVVQIKMTGSRDGDFKAANEEARLTDVVKAQNRRPERAPEGYTWHHRDDFIPIPDTETPPPYGTCTMELVESKAHRGTLEHFGSCDQCNKHTGLTLYK